MISFFFVFFLLCFSFIACFSYNHTHVQPKPIVFHRNKGPSPSCLRHSNSLHQSPWIFFLLGFSPCWPALMTSRRVQNEFFVHPHPFWVVWPPMRFPVRFALVQLHFFQFDLCNSPICVLLPLEITFKCFFAPCLLEYLVLMRLLPGHRLRLDKKKHVAVCDWSESIIVFNLRFLPILNLKQNLDIFGLYLELVTLRLPS